ncbi:E3 ubiquitin-protein ligase TRIM52-like [Mauremys reevesii]|uniref:E3 ubiquitin-protein ligase TRIM52-like n=1 Tax=Mauremys reevesii TaxID=260615 RepID=UPI00193F3170|nr:E3 ubiquitin-protein ligase TRIM52-like [Mauremys reevesii]
MASRRQEKDLQEAVLRSVCWDYCNDMVILKCGHNFCRPCITHGSTTPICVVCRESRSHRDHPVLPVKEAALDYQGGGSRVCFSYRMDIGWGPGPFQQIA